MPVLGRPDADLEGPALEAAEKQERSGFEGALQARRILYFIPPARVLAREGRAYRFFQQLYSRAPNVEFPRDPEFFPTLDRLPTVRTIGTHHSAGRHPAEETMSDELEELKEAAERAKENRTMAPVSLTMAILAVMVATVSLLGHRAHTEEILTQTRATDQWAYYQAKNMRRNNLEALNDVLGALENDKGGQAEKVHQRFEKDIEKYRGEQSEIQNEARGLEDEVNRVSRRADRFDLGEVFWK